MSGVAVAFMLASLWGCAGRGGVPGDDGRQGRSGTVAWTVEDVIAGPLADRAGVRWDYTLVLTVSDGTTIDFERVERTWRSEASREVSRTTLAFPRRLVGGVPLRYRRWDGLAWSGFLPILGSPTDARIWVSLRFLGKDGEGGAVTVDVPLVFDARTATFGTMPARQ